MSVSQNQNIAYSFNQPLSTIFPRPIVSTRSPLTTDKAQIGSVWINKSVNGAWILTSIVANSANWESVSGGSGSFTNLVVSGEAQLGFDSQNSQYQVVASPANHTLALTASQALSFGSSNSSIIGVANTNMSLTAATGYVSITSSDQYVSLDAFSDIDLGTSTATRVIMGNTSATNVAIIASGAPATLGLSIETAGVVSMVPTTPTAASPTASVTSNVRVINAKFTGFTTASNGTQAYTIVSSDILTTSSIFVTVTNLNTSGNNALIGVQGVTQLNGSIVVTTKNNGAGALGAGDSVFVNAWIIS